MKYQNLLKICLMLVFCLCIFSFITPTPAFAAGYLDPGSGSTIVQGIIAAVAVVGRFFRRIKSVFVK